MLGRQDVSLRQNWGCMGRVSAPKRSRLGLLSTACMQEAGRPRQAGIAAAATVNHGWSVTRPAPPGVEVEATKHQGPDRLGSVSP